jgi:hypothetical protein
MRDLDSLLAAVEWMVTEAELAEACGWKLADEADHPDEVLDALAAGTTPDTTGRHIGPAFDAMIAYDGHPSRRCLVIVPLAELETELKHELLEQLRLLIDQLKIGDAEQATLAMCGLLEDLVDVTAVLRSEGAGPAAQRLHVAQQHSQLRFAAA